MVLSQLRSQEVAAVAVLFPPDTVQVIDIFRALGDFEEHYDISPLDQLETSLARSISRECAKGVVSDALLLAFGLRRERSEPIQYEVVTSRRGTSDEYCLMALIGAAFCHDFDLAAEAAAALGIIHPQPLISLAFDIARRLEAAGISLKSLDPRLFREPVGTSSPVEVQDVGIRDRRLNFDL
jgi:hypothetical protein